MNNIHIAIVDDHPMLINGIIDLLRPYEHILVQGTYTNAAQLLEGLSIYQPDVLLLDIMLPDQSGKELVPVILKKYPDMRILVLTSLDAPAMVTTMLRRGCAGYLLKDASPEALVEAIETVYKGEEYIEPRLKKHLIQNVTKFTSNLQNQFVVPELTHREKEILKMITAEYTTREIAEKLFISFRTAEHHRNNLIQKLDVKNTAGLVMVAIQLGLVK